jgi:hypothetical protein
MSALKAFKTNKTSESDGKWFEIDHNDDGTLMRFKLRRTGGANKLFEKEQENKLRPYRTQLRNNKLDKGLHARLITEAFADTCVLDWEHVQIEPGVDTPYSKKVCRELLVDMPDLADALVMLANQIESWRDDAVEDIVKN